MSFLCIWRWWQLKWHFACSHRKLGEMIQYWRAYFFNWIGSTTSERPVFSWWKKNKHVSKQLPWCHDAMPISTFRPWLCQNPCSNKSASVGDVVPARNVPQIYDDWTSKVSLRQPEKGGIGWTKFLVPQRCWAMGQLNKRLPHKWEAVFKVDMLCGQDDVVLSAMRFITISGIIVLRLSCPSIEQDLNK